MFVEKYLIQPKGNGIVRQMKRLKVGRNQTIAQNASASVLAGGLCTASGNPNAGFGLAYLGPIITNIYSFAFGRLNKNFSKILDLQTGGYNEIVARAKRIYK